MRLSFVVLLGIGLAPAAAAPPAAEFAPVEQAVDRALLFLQRLQEPDGSWRSGRYGRNPAITSLAVMAFLSAGHVPGEGRYGDTVEKGVRWVMSVQHPNGLIASNGNHEMYHHGISTLMLAEVAGMTEGSIASEVRKRLEKAVEIILRGQRKSGGEHRGGWRYRVDGSDSDISVTGWQLMALRAARDLGCDVPPESIEQAVAYIRRCRDSRSGGFRYFPNGPVTVPCTGTSILGLEICGKEYHGSPEAEQAATFILSNPPRWGRDGHFFYGIYYCSQAMFQLGENYWNHFRGKLHDTLLPNQRETGGWLGRDSESQVYGPAYATAMSVLALTVEYRFLPIYQRGEDSEKPTQSGK